MSLGRNEKCACGSGKKFKHCCLGKGDPAQAKKNKLLMICAGVVAVLAVAMGFIVSQEAGLATAAVGVAALGAWLWFTAQPPKSGSGSNPSAINFGS